MAVAKEVQSPRPARGVALPDGLPKRRRRAAWPHAGHAQIDHLVDSDERSTCRRRLCWNDGTRQGVPAQGPRLIPRHGPAGTRVHVLGTCFKRDRRWFGPHPGVFLLHRFTGPRECELRTSEADHVVIRADGALRGWFVVAARGSRFQHVYARDVRPGRFDLGLGCLACIVRYGAFVVTPGRL